MASCSRRTHRRRCHSQPANLFVAGFIGSPAMNFVSARLVRDGGPAVRLAEHLLADARGPAHREPGLDGYFGREVILGIRPSDFEDASLADASWAGLPLPRRSPRTSAARSTSCSPSMPRRSATPALPTPSRQRRRTRPSRWMAASRYGPPGSRSQPDAGRTADELAIDTTEPAVLRRRQRAVDRPRPGRVLTGQARLFRLYEREARDSRVSDLPITTRWIWLVPSTICSTLASRISRAAGKSST